MPSARFERRVQLIFGAASIAVAACSDASDPLPGATARDLGVAETLPAPGTGSVCDSGAPGFDPCHHDCGERHVELFQGCVAGEDGVWAEAWTRPPKSTCARVYDV